MKIIFSNHANIKMRQRNLPEDLIIQALHFPDLKRPSRGLREEIYKKFGKKWLKVVIMKEPKAIIVITAHWVVKLK